MKTAEVYLHEVAEIEYRPDKNKVYPIGTIIIQVSATKGQVLFLRKEGRIEDKYAVILPKPHISSFYLFCIIEKFFPKFFEKNRQGLNFKPEDLMRFRFPFHQEAKQREMIAKIMMCFGNNHEAFYIYTGA